MKRLALLLLCCISLICAFAQNTDVFYEMYSHGLDLIKNDEFDKAIAVLDKAYEITAPKSEERRRALYGKGMALYLMAQNLNINRDYDSAYKKYAESMVCFRRIGRDKDVMDCACSMARLNYQLFGCQELAIEQYEYAYDLASNLNLLDKQTEIIGKIVYIYKNLHNEKAAGIYSVKLDSLVSVNYSNTSDYSVCYDRGNQAYQNGDWDVAISYLKKFLSTDPTTEKRFAALQRLRDAYSHKGDSRNALSYSNMCVDDWVKAFDDNPSQKYLIYQNHYPFQIEAGDLAGALASIDSIGISASASDTPLAKGELLMDKARVHGLMKNWSDAVINYRMADSIMSLSDQYIAVRNKREMLVPLYAGALYQNHKLDDSYIQYLRYLEMEKSLYGDKSMEYANALSYLANIEAFMNRLDEGCLHYSNSWKIARDITTQDLRFLPSSERGKYWSKTNDLMWNMIPYGIAAGRQEDDFTSSAFEALIFSKGLLLSAEKSTGRKVQDSGDSNLITDFMSVANLRNEIEQLRAQNKGDEIMNVYARMDSLDKALSIKLSSKNISPSISSVSTSEIASKLKEHEIIIDFADYIKYDNTHIYAAFILRHGMCAPKLLKVFEQSKLDSLVHKNRENYSFLYEGTDAMLMYNTILNPLMEELDDVHTIYFSPSGILNQIAIEAIPLPEGDMFGDRFNVIQLTNSKEILSYCENSHMRNFASARLYGGLDYDIDADIMALQAKEPQIPPLFAFRGAASGLNAREGFKKLEMSASEVTEISDILTQNSIKVDKLMDIRGTEESFISMSGKSPDLLLISTHGFYYSPENVPAWSSLNGYDNPMYLTGLVLSGGNAEYLRQELPEGVMGGLLTSSDISRLDLSDTQMVVLSACETGLGDTSNEGVYGLQRAFKNAGAQTLVMSLWPVSDKATKDFMVLFHNELATNSWDKRLAFKNAKRSLRQKYSEPYYWAAFIMVD